ncbi:MAG: hypothetical protein R3328_07455 [Planococcaceae bacterium]|nr:hypothetical protein [Planococcaceae bacterium]
MTSIKYLSILFIFSLFFSIVTGCSNSIPGSGDGKSSADWANSFVVWEGYIYRISDEYIDDISEEIGEVTKYSDMEGTYSGNFSNAYRKGTKFYTIKGISSEEAIAIAEDGKYRKAIRNGKYGEK